MRERVDALTQAFLVDMNDQLQLQPFHLLIAETDHFPKLPGRIDMQ